MTSTIVHTTDLGSSDLTSLSHSVALARAANATLVSLHVNAPQSSVTKMLDAASLLAKWGDVSTQIDFRKEVHNYSEDAVDTVLDALGKIQPDLVVASTRRRGNLARFFAGSDAEAIARNVSAPTLLLPYPTRAFVDPGTGNIDLHQVLVPIGHAQEASAALEAATWLAAFAGVTETEFVLLHVGEAKGALPQVPPMPPGWTVARRHVGGSSIEAGILEHALEASIVVMATRGHNSAGDVVLGSHTERVLHGSACPILSVGV